MATTFANAKAALDEISVRLLANNRRMASAKAEVATALGDLTAMATNYATIVADIDAAAAAVPTNVALSNMKAEKDLLVAEFGVAQARATGMNAAIGSL